MSEYYFINGKVEIYDFEKFRDWLFEELQKQDLVGVFDININEANKCVCEKCGGICQESLKSAKVSNSHYKNHGE